MYSQVLMKYFVIQMKRFISTRSLLEKSRFAFNTVNGTILYHHVYHYCTVL